MSPDKVFCQHPIKIVNPKCVDFVLSNFGDVYFVLQENNLPKLVPFKPRLFGDYTSQQLKKYILKILRSQLRLHPEYAFLGTHDGECLDFFIYVPCGHCLLCNHKKRVSLASKCSMESQQHDNLPLFVTLTYDDAHLPPFGLRYSDVQKFLKRLRVTLNRHYSFDGHLRYVCAGEYGGKYQRPHYHLIIWDFPESSVGNLFKIDSFIRSVWSKGLTQSKRCFNSDAGFYLGKYLSKSVNADTPTNLVKPFHVCSINLGLEFVRKTCEYILINNPEHHDFHYCDKFDGKLKRLPLVSYFIKKMFPSKSEFVPCEYRDALFDCINQFRSFPLMSILDKVTFDLVHPLLSTIDKEVFYTHCYHGDWLHDAVFKLCKHFKYSLVSDEWFFINEQTRTLYYLSLLAEFDFDVDLKAKIINKQLSHELEKEFL